MVILSINQKEKNAVSTGLLPFVCIAVCRMLVSDDLVTLALGSNTLDLKRKLKVNFIKGVHINTEQSLLLS